MEDLMDIMNNTDIMDIRIIMVIRHTMDILNNIIIIGTIIPNHYSFHLLIAGDAILVGKNLSQPTTSAPSGADVLFDRWHSNE
ncbi:hypothetical protein SBF1_970005 [Candidatus Desulfosporosinus infrequens]|uniref:Uncharacterized protein n=1 Tax=Candidatus Desulfosporosinus infrequens TaxID=2043169 RepID=A0A2U3LYR1_9FIRM|nr:hypothetical protein SBF1_970005 [Candidatus Desulfosporosinus infrequens]